MKQLWLACFTSLLARMPPEQAIAEADRSLMLCNERWEDPERVQLSHYKHNFPVGWEFDATCRAAPHYEEYLPTTPEMRERMVRGESPFED